MSSNNYYISPGVLRSQPKLLKCVKDTSTGSDYVKHLGAKLEMLRRLYRRIRNDGQRSHADVMQELDALYIDSLTNQTTAYYNTMRTLIGLAGYVEDTVVYLPQNHLPLWAYEIKLESIYTLIHHGLTTTGSLYATQALLGSYVWWQMFPETFGTFSRQLYEISGYRQERKHTDGRTFLKHGQETFGIEYEKRTLNPGTYYTELKIKWNQDLPLEGVTAETVEQCGYGRVQALKAPSIPEPLQRQIKLHNMYYPQAHYQALHRACPLLLTDGTSVTIPMVAGIVPILVATLLPFHTLYYWLKEGGANDPKPYQIPRFYEKVQQWLEALESQVSYPLIQEAVSHGEIASFEGQHIEAQYAIMQRGLPVDRDQLSASAVARFEQTGNKEVDRIRQRIDQAIARTGGRYCGVYQRTSKTGRTHYRRNNIQGFPGYLKEAVKAPDGQVFVQADVVSNDLSILFNLSNDPRGLMLLRQPEKTIRINGPAGSVARDAYYEIARRAYPNQMLTPEHRSRVKRVFNPWLYGQDPEGTSEEAHIPLQEVEGIIDGIATAFPASVDWIQRLSVAVKKHWEIPAEMNPFEYHPIHMPKYFHRRIAPTFLIQRMSARIMKYLVGALHAEPGFPGDILVTVHDSVLVQCETSRAEQVIASIQQAMNGALRDVTNGQVTVLNLKYGCGTTWKGADTDGRITCQNSWMAARQATLRA